MVFVVKQSDTAVEPGKDDSRRSGQLWQLPSTPMPELLNVPALHVACWSL